VNGTPRCSANRVKLTRSVTGFKSSAFHSLIDVVMRLRPSPFDQFARTFFLLFDCTADAGTGTCISFTSSVAQASESAGSGFCPDFDYFFAGRPLEILFSKKCVNGRMPSFFAASSFFGKLLFGAILSSNLAGSCCSLSTTVTVVYAPVGILPIESKCTKKKPKQA
jgi:hypothetical protein